MYSCQTCFALVIQLLSNLIRLENRQAGADARLVAPTVMRMTQPFSTQIYFGIVVFLILHDYFT